ncbi:hypothetical protein ACFFRR_005348 [Megaselia abdita]
MEAHKNNNNFYATLFYDKIYKALDPLVLYIKNPSPKVLQIIELLTGVIITRNQYGCQVKFRRFKEAAFAHEELKKETSVKFAYISEVPKSHYQVKIRVNQENTPQSEMENDIRKIFQKYACYTPALRSEFKKTLEEMEENQPKPKVRKEEKLETHDEESQQPFNSKSEATVEAMQPTKKQRRERFVFPSTDESSDEEVPEKPYKSMFNLIPNN